MTKYKSTITKVKTKNSQKKKIEKKPIELKVNQRVK
jgi:hypothetical protein